MNPNRPNLNRAAKHNVFGVRTRPVSASRGAAGTQPPGAQAAPPPVEAQSGLGADFASLTPDVIIDAVEAAHGQRLAGFANPLKSYINRVYELQCVDKTRVIAKFYRPGRWSLETLHEEHEFVRQCAADDIPVVAPFALSDGSTLGTVEGIRFAVYPKRLGRQWEPCNDEDWRRLGRLIGRVHAVGKRQAATHRVRLSPTDSTDRDVAQLLDGGFISPKHRKAFAEVARDILDLIRPLFDGVEFCRIHGDCHSGNILDRPGEGLSIIDFDDMVAGAPVHDLWMLLPDRADQVQRELDLILEGYRMFCDFDARSLVLIEPLRVMRMLYFQAWISRQVGDAGFAVSFPEWGTEAFWMREIGGLQRQLDVIRDHLPDPGAVTEVRVTSPEAPPAP